MYFRMGGRDERERYQYNYQTVLKYLEVKCQNKQIELFFEENNMKKIAIYGVDDLGKCLIQDLVNSEAEIVYIVDQAYYSYPEGYLGIPVISPGEIQEQTKVDAMVITVLFELNSIIDLLMEKDIELEKIINISDVVYSL